MRQVRERREWVLMMGGDMGAWWMMGDSGVVKSLVILSLVLCFLC